jgi:PRTRC genetic system ThiF family protein
MKQPFYLPPEWLTRRVRILLVGAGGTGGEVLYALARMHTVLLALGHPGGLALTLVDGDRVSAPNIGRQRFYACDIRHNKASVLIHRMNLAFGLDWQAKPTHWSTDVADHTLWFGRYDLLVSCVDRASVRVALARAGARLYPAILWMDFGNGQYAGQCILGHLGQRRESSEGLRLPNVFDLYPELKTVNDDAQPSCSSVEAIRQQDLFTNPLIAEAGVSLLWRLMRTGQLDAHGTLIDARGPSVTPLPIDPDLWSFLTHTPRRPRRAKKTLRAEPRPTRTRAPAMRRREKRRA